MEPKKLQVESQPLQPLSLGDGGTKTRVAILEGLGNSARELHDAVAPMAQRATADQAQQRGQADALKGTFQPERNPSFAAQEYNRAGFQTALSELEISMRTRVDQIYDEAKNDPATLKLKFDAYGKEVEKNLREGGLQDITPEFRSMYDRATLPHSRQAADDHQRSVAAANTASSMSVLESRLNDGERFARSSEVDGQMQMALLEEGHAFDQHLISQGPKGAFSFNGVQYPTDPTRSGIYDPVDMQKLTTQWNQRIAQGAVLGGFDRADGIKAKTAYVDAWEKKEKTRKGSPFDLDQVDQLSNRMRIDISKEQSKADAFKVQLQKQINEDDKVYAENHTPPGRIALRKAASDYPDLIAQMDIQEANGGMVSNYAKLTPAVQHEVLSQLDAKQVLSPAQIELKKQFQKVGNETETLLKNDAVSLMPRFGETPPPIDLANPATFANRAGTSGFLAAHYGIDHHGLYKSEVDGLSTILHTNTADVNAGYLSGMRAGMDDKRLTALAQDLMPTNPEFAAVMGIAGERPDVASDVLHGMDVLKLDTGVKPDTASIQTETDAYFGDEMSGLGIDGKNRVMIEQAALALDAGRRDKAGKKGKDQFDTKEFKQALDDITGGTYRWHGKKIISPDRDVDVDTFANMMDSLKQDDIKGMVVGGVGAPAPGSSVIKLFDPGVSPRQQVSIEDFKNRAKLQSVGDGNYLVMIDGGFATDAKTGKSFEFNIKALLPDLKSRNRRVNIMGVNLTPDLSAAR